MHRNLLQFFMLVGGLGAVLAVVSFTPPRLVPASDTRANPQPNTRQAAWAARVESANSAGSLRPSEPVPPQEIERSSGAEPQSIVERSATDPLRLLEQTPPASVNAAVVPPSLPTPAPAKPATVTNAAIISRLEHPSCKLPTYTKEVAVRNLKAVGTLDSAEASRVWDTFDEFCRRDFSTFYEVGGDTEGVQENQTVNAQLPSAEALGEITLSPEAFQQVEAFVSSVWQAQGYNSEFPGAGVLKPRQTGALGADAPVATAPLGVQCGGRTISPLGLGPTWWTCLCTGCCIPCGLGCCLPSCELGCRPNAYLWDSITGICGCGL